MAATRVPPPAITKGPDGKWLLPDIPDEEFKKDTKVDPTTYGPDDNRPYTVSEVDETDGPTPQLTVAGATADPFKDYVGHIEKIPLLTAEAEVELGLRIEAGLVAAHHLDTCGNIEPVLAGELAWLVQDGCRAKETFILANLRLVIWVARRYLRRMPVMDLIQDGNLGLIRAVEKFDHRLGGKFSVYAVWWIRQSVSRAIADTAYVIRIPVHLQEKDAPVVAERNQRINEGRGTSARAIATAVGLNPAEVELILRRHRAPYSLEALADAGLDIVGSETTVPAEVGSLALLQEQLHAVLDTLSEREAGVVSMRFGLTDEPMKLAEIGAVNGVTGERIRQIEGRAMAKLRHTSRSQTLLDYLDHDYLADDDDVPDPRWWAGIPPQP